MHKRWEQAQTAEANHRHHNILDTVAEANDKLANFELDVNDLEGQDVLAVGGGTGMIHKINGAISIDPLPPDNSEVFEESKASVLTAIGENLPFDYDEFDVVICYNVLDHVINPRAVLNEIHRVLRSEGELLFRLNVYELPEAILSKLSLIDRPHLHHYNSEGIKHLLADSGFEIDVTNYVKMNISDFDRSEITVKKVAGRLFQWSKIYIRGKKQSIRE